MSTRGAREAAVREAHAHALTEAEVARSAKSFKYTCAYCSKPTSMPPYIGTLDDGEKRRYPSCCFRGDCVAKHEGKKVA